MFRDIGSAARLVGVVVSLLGFSFAIPQLVKLRGETRAAREAAESARRAIHRDLTNTELVRLDGTIQNLKEVHRTGNRDQALYEYATVLRALREIGLSHPTLSPEQQTEISRSISAVSNMEQAVEALPGEILQDASVQMNRTLNEIQSGLLLELENQLTRENS